jgi:6-phosphogluconolactonase
MRPHLPLAAAAAVLAGVAMSAQAADSPQKLWVYFGTYTGGQSASKGIYVSTLDLATGRLSPPEVAAEITSPAFLALHPKGRFLYAVNEVGSFQGERAGAVSAFRVDPQTGRLTLLNQQSSRGPGPCHISVDPSGRTALVANYGGGSVAALPLQADGSLGKAASFVQHAGSSVDKRRQEGPHAHSINPDPRGRFAYAADLGLDQVLVYRLDAAAARLTPAEPPHARTAPGSGPRHFDMHPSGKFAFVCGEMTSTVTAFAVDSRTGALTEVNTLSTIPAPTPGNSTAELRVHPSGKFVYVSNRGHNSIAIFRVDGKTGALTAAGHQPTGGSTPRNFGMDPTGKFLLAANQASNNVVVFRIDGETGQLSPTESRIEVPVPVCVRFLPRE